MLIALEEEAAAESHILQNSSNELAWLDILSKDVQQQNALQDVELSVANRCSDCGVGTSGGKALSNSLHFSVMTCESL